MKMCVKNVIEVFRIILTFSLISVIDLTGQNRLGTIKKPALYVFFLKINIHVPVPQGIIVAS